MLKRILFACAFVGLLGLTLANVRADEWNKKTVITINEPIQVPNLVLAPGTYVMKLLDSPSDRHLVQIYNADETKLLTTIMAIPNYRLQPADKTVLEFWETPPGHPKALRAWFYPGDNFGQEFAYPKREAVTIVAVSHAPVPSTEEVKPEQLPTTPVETVTEAPQETVAQAEPAAPLFAPQEPQEAPALPLELPKTASPYPLVGLAGLMALGISGLLRLIRTS
jgi:hypothetical protein